MDKQNEVLLNTFVISKKKYRVFYNAGVLVWEAENSKKGGKRVCDQVARYLLAPLEGKPVPRMRIVFAGIWRRSVKGWLTRVFVYSVLMNLTRIN